MNFRDLGDKLTGRSASNIRLMEPADLDEVLRMIRLHDSDDYKAAKQSFDKSRFDLPLEVSAHVVIDDPKERRPVGVCGYYVDDLEARGLYWLGWTYVNPFFRGRGYGGELLEHVFGMLANFRARKIYLTTSSLPKYASAVKFYERHGFVQEGKLLDYYADGDHQLVMGCRLDRRATRRAPLPRRSAVEPPAPKRAPASKTPSADQDIVFEF